MKRILIYSLGILLVLIGLGVSIGSWILFKEYRGIDRTYQEARQAWHASYDQHHQAFFEDQEALREFHLLKGPKHTRDAGTWLNPLLAWSHPEHGDMQDPLKISEGVQSLLEEAHTSDASTAQQVLRAENLVLVEGLDFQWMDQLLGFDYWSLETNSPFSEALDKEPLYNRSEVNLSPNYTTFRHWTWLRILKSMKDGSYAKASKEIQHLAALLFTQERLIGILIGITILDQENQAYQWISESSDLDLDWEPIESETLERLRRYAFASVSFTDPIGDLEIMRTHFSDLLRPMQCIALEELTHAGLLTKFEPIHRHHLESYFDLISEFFSNTEGYCRLEHIRLIWRNPDYRKRHMKGVNLFETTSLKDPTRDSEMEGDSFFDVYQASRWALGSRLLSKVLMSIAIPNRWRLYQEDSSSTFLRKQRGVIRSHDS